MLQRDDITDMQSLAASGRAAVRTQDRPAPLVIQPAQQQDQQQGQDEDRTPVQKFFFPDEQELPDSVQVGSVSDSLFCCLAIDVR